MKGGKNMPTSLLVIALVIMACLVSSSFARAIDEDAIHAIMFAREKLGYRCRAPGEYCSYWESKECCEGLYCKGPVIGASKECVPYDYCRKEGKSCASGYGTQCCYPLRCFGNPGECEKVSSINEVVKG